MRLGIRRNISSWGQSGGVIDNLEGMFSFHPWTFQGLSIKHCSKLVSPPGFKGKFICDSLEIQSIHCPQNHRESFTAGDHEK